MMTEFFHAALPLADMLAAGASAVKQPLHWADLGLKRGIDLGFFTLRYYSLAYLAGIIFGYWHMTRMIRQPGSPLAQRHVEDLFFWCTLGIILGGRLGYATFYDHSLYTEPLKLLRLWEGGMSFHGGLIGVLVAVALVCRNPEGNYFGSGIDGLSRSMATAIVHPYNSLGFAFIKGFVISRFKRYWVSGRGVNGSGGSLSFIRVMDYMAPCAPVGLLFGRIANFINGELWGRVAGSDVPWAMVFPDEAAGSLPRHPSQLYEAGLEGLVLGAVLFALFWLTRARWRPGMLMGTFSLGYGLSRFIVEFYREPDQQLEEFAARTHMSMGQWLTVPMILLGLWLIVRSLRRPMLGAPVPVRSGADG